MAFFSRSYNRVVLVGRVGQDPEVRSTASGMATARFSLATTEVSRDRNERSGGPGGGWNEMTEWHRIVAWGALAERAQKTVAKGVMILVEGRLRTRKWQDKQGMERVTTEVVADTFVPLERRDAGSSGGGGGRSWSSEGSQGRGGDRYGSQQQARGGSGGGYGADDYGVQAPLPEAQIDGDPFGDDSDPF